MTTLNATYDPQDDKLRLYASSRLDVGLYEQIKKAGFAWAPKQGLFFAIWTPERCNLLLTICDEIQDEDKSLVERAEERAERFGGYSDSRTQDAVSARAAVSAIADNIPMGQPILIGHHSERHARKQAEKIENGMRKAIQLWDTASYWKSRAAGAIRAAKYKELPAVRARRIKTIEADLRKTQKDLVRCEELLSLWTSPDITPERVRQLAGMSYSSFTFPLADYPRELPASQYEGAMGIDSALSGGIITPDQAVALVVPGFEHSIERSKQWIDHYNNRIVYERAMLQEQGGLTADKFDIQVGGRVLVRGEWCVVMRVNKRDGKTCSVTTNARYVPTRNVEEIADYRAPTEEDAKKIKAVSKLAPMANYPGDGFLQMSKAEWERIHADYKGSRELGQDAQRPGGHRMDLKDAGTLGATYARHRVRSVVRAGKLQGVFLTDSKRVEPPAATPSTTPRPEIEAPEREFTCVSSLVPKESSAQALEFQAMKDSLKEGIKTVTAPQLFPTPPDLAARMVDEAGLTLGMRVLEPSAGTGRILQAFPFVLPFGAKRQTGLDVVAVEINAGLAKALEFSGLASEVKCADFLQCNGDLGKFDAVLLNPPYAEGQDIAHIKHALTFLKPGGRLVALCADGPRQNEKLLPIVEQYGGSWEKLPPNTFKASGTGVNTVLLSLTVH